MRGSLALAAAVLLAGCESMQLSNLQVGNHSVNVGKIVQGGRELRDALAVTEEQEKTMGREAAANLAAKYGLYDDPELLRYVNLVGLSVARNAERPGVEYRFGVLNTEDLNAYAAPGGYVFVTKGLLKILGDEAMLAGVLAHEIEHVDKRHAVGALRKQNLLKAGAHLTSEKLQSKAGMDLASSLIIGVLERGFDKSDEKEADVAGVQLLARSGYDPTGLPRALEEHHAVEGQAKANPFTARHPPFETRMQAIASVKGLPESGAVNKKRFLKSVSF